MATVYPRPRRQSTTGGSPSRSSNPSWASVLGAERFLAEIQVTANLQHPNLLPLFDSGEAGWAALLRHAVRRRRDAAPPDRARETASGRRGPGHRGGRGERAGIRPRARSHSPRPQAREHPPAGRPAGRGRLRNRARGEQCRRPARDAVGDVARHAAVHEPRASHRRPRRSTPAPTSTRSAPWCTRCSTGEPPHSAPTAQATIAKLLTEEARSVATLRRCRAGASGRRGAACARETACRSIHERSLVRRRVAGEGARHRARARRRDASGARNLRLMLGRGTLRRRCLVAAFAVWRATSARGRSGADRPATRSRFRATRSTSPAAGFVSPSRRTDRSSPTSAAAPSSGSTSKGSTISSQGRIPGTEGASNPQFSPDGAVDRVPASARSSRSSVLSGGVPVTIADSVDRFSWGDGDVVVFAQKSPPSRASRNALFRTSAAGGPIELLATPDSTQRERSYSWPSPASGREGRALQRRAGAESLAGIVGVGRDPPRRQEHRALSHRGDESAVRCPRGTSCTRFRIATVMAVPFDAKRLQVTGTGGSGARKRAAERARSNTVRHFAEWNAGLRRRDAADTTRVWRIGPDVRSVLVPDTVRRSRRAALLARRQAHR